MLRPEATDDDILGLVRKWCALLAAGDYVAALALIPGDAHWTPELLKRVITNYGSPVPRSDGKHFRVTALDTAKGERPPDQDVEWFGDRGEVWFDLPLNGQWSDLTATFRIERRSDGIALTLDDVHVH